MVLPGTRVRGVSGARGFRGRCAGRNHRLPKRWIDQLYVLPEVQGRGVGSELLQVAMCAFDRLQLWTFQRNIAARRFYEARGFVLVRETDGSGNEEKEPDALYIWTR